MKTASALTILCVAGLFSGCNTPAETVANTDPAIEKKTETPPPRKKRRRPLKPRLLARITAAWATVWTWRSYRLQGESLLCARDDA
ncbi:MAG TPA: hypothetical protein EYN66_07480 [Myxococcales bacterium]|nr:hypothetical protein [Myxococcales bacterium]